jgi:K+:H+ antiporter
MDASPILVFLGQAAILVCAPYLIWSIPAVNTLFPLVVVQIVLGIALGPSLLGSIAPAASALLDAPELAALTGIAWLAVVMFAFLTGLHFDTAETTGRSRAFLLTSLSSFAVPAALGLLAGLLLIGLEPTLAGPNGDAMLFACASVSLLP